ncbi:MAG: hypothetical protein QM692_01645 [Thermomicrobiales bacterium]
MRPSRNPQRRSLIPVWLWLLPLSLACSGMLLGIRSDDDRLLNRSAAVLLLAIALVCVRTILDEPMF